MTQVIVMALGALPAKASQLVHTTLVTSDRLVTYTWDKTFSRSVFSSFQEWVNAMARRPSSVRL